MKNYNFSNIFENRYFKVSIFKSKLLVNNVLWNNG